MLKWIGNHSDTYLLFSFSNLRHFTIFLWHNAAVYTIASSCNKNYHDTQISTNLAAAVHLGIDMVVMGEKLYQSIFKLGLKQGTLVKRGESLGKLKNIKSITLAF